MDNQPDKNLLTTDEQYGIIAAQSSIMRAKAALCDRQHELQAAQSAAETAQRALAIAEQQLNGAVLQAAYARGIKSGNVQLSQDGTRIEA